MGRRENPVTTCDRDLGKLVNWLRSQRTQAGLSYKQLAARSGCSASTLIRAASGAHMPKLKVVQGYAAACGASLREAERLWKRARYRAVRSGEDPAPHPRYVRSFADLHVALVDHYQKDGARPYAELETASGNVLAHATVGRFFRQKGGRPTRDFVVALARTCGARGKALQDWEQAWDRAEEQRLGGAAKSAERRPGLLFGLLNVTGDGVPMFVRSEPRRTADGQEVRRLTPVPPSQVPNYLAHVRTMREWLTPLSVPTSLRIRRGDLNDAKDKGARRTRAVRRFTRDFEAAVHPTLFDVKCDHSPPEAYRYA
ncbi:helix-turn-helix domain-containing protein [Streptomyces flavofungini]|uniref:helix-turn-helix domain-containing protein n=1 Tax=Streptomyces flavofungini TaxID=68200 RepID=UPI0034DF47BE